MANISTLSPASTYQDILNLNANGQGLQSYPVQIQDGLGNITNLSIWNAGFNIDRGLGVFQLDGVALTATAAQLNSLVDVTGAEYLILSPNADLPNASTLNVSAGLVLVPGVGTTTLSLAGEVEGLENIANTGIVVRSNVSTYVTRTLQTDATISINHPGGIGGNPLLGVVNDTSTQRIAVQANGVTQSTRSIINFIPGSDVGITINDNIGNNRADIILTVSPAPPSNLNIVGTSNQIAVITVGDLATVSLVDDVIITSSVRAGNLRLLGNSLEALDANGNVNIVPNGTGIISLSAQLNAINGSSVSPSLSFTNDDSTGFYLSAAGVVTYSSLTNVLLNFGTGGLELKGNSSTKYFNPTNTFSVGFVAGAVTADVLWTLPLTDSTGVQALVSDGAGNLSWDDYGGVEDVLGTANEIVANNVAGVITLSLADSVIINTSIGVPLGSLGDLEITGNTITALNAGGGISLVPNGAGSVVLDGITYPSTDGTAGQVLTTNGAGVLSFTSLVAGVTSITGTANQITASAPTGAVTLSLPADVDITTSLDVANLSLSGNTLVSSNTNGNINITPNGSGRIILDGITYPATDGSGGQALVTNGAGVLSFGTINVGVTSITGTANQITASASTGAVTLSMPADVDITTSLDVANISLAGNTIASSNSNGNVLLVPNGTGNVLIGSAVNAASLLWQNTTNANLVGFQSGISTASVTWTLPVSDATGSQALVSNGAGILSWADFGTVQTINGTVNQIGVATVGATSTIALVNNIVVATSLTAPTLVAGNLSATGNTLSSTNTNGNITLTPNGTGKIILKGLTYPSVDGTVGQVISTDGAGNLSFSNASATAFTVDVAQVAHGFAVGNVIYLNGTTYTKAIATSVSAAEVIGFVSAVADADHFTYQFGGSLIGLTGLTAGSVYFLSDTTAGLATTTEPTTTGYVSKPLFISNSTTTAIIISESRGNVITNTAGISATGVAKAWVKFNGTGTVTINASFNVASITDNGTGSYTVNFTTAMSSADYVATVSGQATAAGASGRNGFVSIDYATQSSGSLGLFCAVLNAYNATDLPGVYVACFGN